MKYRLLTLLGLIALSGVSMPAWSQDYDDVYYDAKKDNREQTISKPAAAQVKSQPQRVVISGNQPYKVTVQSNSSNIINGRDVDEYNRRKNYDCYDTIAYDNQLAGSDFSNTQRIERFYNPDIIINSNDNDLITLYYDSTPTINLTIGSSWWGPSIGWGWSGWYGPRWSYSYYDPWFTWYGPHWYAGWNWGWNDPWFSWGWGWQDPFWGWGGPHHFGWGGPGPHYGDWAWDGGPRWNSRNEGGRRPMGYVSNNGGRNGFASANGGNAVTGRRPMGVNGNSNYTSPRNNGGNQSTTVTGHRGASTYINAGNTDRMSTANASSRANVGNVGNMSRRPMINQQQATTSNSTSNNRVYVPSTQRRSTATVDNSHRSSNWDNARTNSPSSSSWGGSRSWGGGSNSSSFGGGGGHNGGFSGGGGHRR